MELEIIENNFISEKIENFLTNEKFEEFKKSLQKLASVDFGKNEAGRKKSRSLARKVGTLKTKITEKFDDLIKLEKAKNDEFVKYLKTLTSTKAKYLAECEGIQKIIKTDAVAFDDRINIRLEAMKSYLRQYQSLQELSDAKQGIIENYENFQWEEKGKDASKLLGELLEKLVMQEGMIANLEREKAERQRIEAEREQDRLVREREEQERLIREQAERVAQGKEIELPPVEPPALVPTPQERAPIQKEKEEETYTIVFDTETTGVNNKNDRIVQIAALVFDQDFNKVDSLNVLIKQDKEMTDREILTHVHGKTYKMCQEKGISIADALTQFIGMLDGCNVAVAHNMPFDEGFLKSEANRHGINFEIKARKMDTMALYNNIVKCPPTERMINAGYTSYKKPNLTECYNFVFGKDFDNAHDAFGDIKATAEIYQNLVTVNRRVVSIIQSMGLSQDQARCMANKLRLEDLTNYRNPIKLHLEG